MELPASKPKYVKISNNTKDNKVVPKENGTFKTPDNPWPTGSLTTIVNSLTLKYHLLTGDTQGDSFKVIDFRYPRNLEELMDLELEEEGVEFENIHSIIERSIKYSVKTCHPHFYNQLYGGADEVGVAGAWLTEALNTNQHTFEVAPVFIVVEKAIINKVISLLEWSDGDGIFCPGGSSANMYSMALARYRKHPDIKTKGLYGMKPMVCFTSIESHYSVKKNAHWLGFGTDNLIYVPADARGCMIPEELEKAVVQCLADGKEPLLVNATAGTTVLGAFDPLHPIADVCQKYGLWLHVDAAWGGAVILSKKYKKYLDGVDRVDSFAWNPHKMIGAPLQCTVFTVKEKDLLHKCNSASADYLFQADKFYDVNYDTGDKSVQCGRKADAFKLWLMWKIRGSKCLANRVDQVFDKAYYLIDVLRKRPGFKLVLTEIQCPNISFWYIPERLRNQEETDEWWEEISKIPPRMKELMVMDGSMMVGYQPLSPKGLVNFFRLIICCMPEPTFQHMDFIADEFDRIGRYL